MDSSALPVKMIQSIGQISTHASHSMQRSRRNTVCTSQFRQRWVSRSAVCTSKPSSTSIEMEFRVCSAGAHGRSEEHTSELQSLMRISYAVFCLKKKKTITQNIQRPPHNTRTI